MDEVWEIGSALAYALGIGAAILPLFLIILNVERDKAMNIAKWYMGVLLLLVLIVNLLQ